MGLMSMFRRTPPSASVAKERLRIIVAQERSRRGGPDYLPMLRRELLEVIRKYVKVEPDDVMAHVERAAGHDVLELSVSVSLPGKGGADRNEKPQRDVLAAPPVLRLNWTTPVVELTMSA